MGLYSYTMIFLIWTNWYINLLFCYMILCNFLIGIICNAYNTAIEGDVETRYALKSDLNQEISLYNKWKHRDY